MIRTSAKLTGLVALAVLGGAMGVNCSSKKGDDHTGTLSVALVVPPGVTISAAGVTYDIKEGAPVSPDSAIADITGVINVSDPNSTASVDHSFPRSTGDTVTLDADTVATTIGGVSYPSVHCHGVSPAFSVTAGSPALVSVSIICPNGANVTPNQNNGSVVVSGTFMSNGDTCPLLTSWVASPLQTSAPGGTIDVNGSATDADGNTMTVLWTAAPGGTFTAPTSFATQYHCGAVAAGTSEAETLTLTVDDGHGCTAAIGIPVTCVGTAVTTGTGGTTGVAGAPGTGGTGVAGAPGTGGTGVAGAPGTGGTGVAGAPGTGGTGVAGAPGTGGTGVAGASGTGGDHDQPDRLRVRGDAGWHLLRNVRAVLGR